jgi:thiamine pyrophosphate-dependent acetolactate synthase large subunit-like protein
MTENKRKQSLDEDSMPMHIVKMIIPLRNIYVSYTYFSHAHAHGRTWRACIQDSPHTQSRHASLHRTQHSFGAMGRSGEVGCGAHQSVAIVGDGGFAMLMAELTTAVQMKLPVKVMVPKNNSLTEVRFEQTDLGYQPFKITLGRSTSSPMPRRAGA